MKSRLLSFTLYSIMEQYFGNNILETNNYGTDRVSEELLIKN